AATRARVSDAIPKLVIACRMPPTTAPAAADLEIAAQLLAGGKTSRLYRALVATNLASEGHAELSPGQLRLVATASDRIDPAALEAKVRAELAGLRTRVTADELAGAKASLDTDLVSRLEAVAVRAEVFAMWAAYDVRGVAGARQR